MQLMQYLEGSVNLRNTTKFFSKKEDASDALFGSRNAAFLKRILGYFHFYKIQSTSGTQVSQRAP